MPTPQIGIQRIEECIHITHGRRPIGPPDVIRIVFISYNVVFLGGANQPPCHVLEGALNAISKRVKFCTLHQNNSNSLLYLKALSDPT